MKKKSAYNILKDSGHKNIVEVTVTTPVEISDEVELSIKKYISSIKKGEVKLTKKKDESLIAGFTLDFDNTRLDASIRKRISMMKKQLKTN